VLSTPASRPHDLAQGHQPQAGPKPCSLARDSPNLDLLRALAVLYVYFSHLGPAFALYPASSIGKLGVVLFFVHTSLVLMASLERLQQSGRYRAWQLAAAFWVRRIFRIYPLAIFCIVLVVWLRIPSGALGAYQWIGGQGLLANLLLIQNLTGSQDIWGVMWSLPLEVQMYGILPFAYFLVRKWRDIGTLLWIFSLLPAFFGLFAIWKNGLPGLGACAPFFFAGVAGFAHLRGAKWKLPAWAWPLGILCVTLLFHAWDDAGFRSKVFIAWPLSLGLGLLVAHVREGEWPWIHAVAGRIAKWSYGIYLSHMFVFWMALKAASPWLRVGIVAVASVMIPWLLYRWIEDPFVRLGSLLAGGFEGSAPIRSQS
jgi:peptidoglycan/LPS O-acetylase OafA/YrhL